MPTTTTTIPTPEPSPEAQKVIDQDKELRAWLLIKSPDQGFQAFWDPTFDPEKPGDPTQLPPKRGWGTQVDLKSFFEGAFSARTTRFTEVGTAIPSAPKGKGTET